MGISHSFKFATDTATMCAFDLASLQSHLHDDADWWTTPDVELAEVNNGNAAFIGLGQDGVYEVTLTDSLPDPDATISISVPSGKIFVGAGEETTGDGLEPEGLRGGIFLDLRPGSYTICVRKTGYLIRLFLGAGGTGRNQLGAPIRLT